MEIGGGPIASFGDAPAERLSRYRVARPYGRSLRVFYGHSLRHLRFDYRDPGEPFVCCRDLRCGSLLRNFFDPALVVASEDLRVGTWGERGGAVAFNGEKSHVTQLPTAKTCNGLFSTATSRTRLRCMLHWQESAARGEC